MPHAPKDHLASGALIEGGYQTTTMASQARERTSQRATKASSTISGVQPKRSCGSMSSTGPIASLPVHLGLYADKHGATGNCVDMLITALDNPPYYAMSPQAAVGSRGEAAIPHALIGGIG